MSGYCKFTAAAGLIAGASAFSGQVHVNTCLGAKLDLPNAECFSDSADVTPKDQAPSDVTTGYAGDIVTDVQPITTSYKEAGLCAVNVHFHLGSEHRSGGEYDEDGSGPTEVNHRRLLSGKARPGFQCHHYDSHDEKFTKPFDWKHCQNMEVGQTYEVHWPNSAAGACGTVDQFQTPFYDGVFCNLNMETLLTLKPQDIASAVGVQAQVFTVVNDEDYYTPDLMYGWTADAIDIAKYTGSTTGDSRDNELCSMYSPITWQVDRKCHMISASSFDKMCADMLSQADDMSDDVSPHGSRELVLDTLAANNHQ